MVTETVEITFAPDAEQAPTWYSLLRRIPCAGGPGSWPAGTKHVEIIRPLGGGRSGGRVLLAEINHSPSRTLCVIKIDQAHALTREWSAYEQHIAPLRAGLFAPIIAATPNVVAGTAGPDEFAAVVYSEASEFTGLPGDAVRTLDELVAEAEEDPTALPDTLAVLEHALRAAGRLHQYHSIEPGKQSLRFLNPRLGPSLGIRADASPAETITDDEVLRGTLGGFVSDLAPDDRVRLEALTAVGEELIGQEITVTCVGTVADPTSVNGTVLWSRGHERRARLLEAVRPSEVVEQWWRVGDVVVADPFTALERVLTEPLENRVYSRSHGDLNVGNVVVVSNHPCFIDYAHTTDRAPQQADHAWLEVSFLRDRFAGLPFDEIVRVQRALAVASRLLHLGTPADDARDRGRVLVGAAGMVAFDVLFVVRIWAQRCYPHDAGAPEWWRDHLCHLLLAAHRTLKWTGAVQNDAKLRAMAAVASVATEWLTDSSPFTHWNREDQEHAVTEIRLRLVAVHGIQPIRELLTSLQSTHDSFVDLLAENTATDVALPRRPALAMATLTTCTALTGGPRSGKTTALREAAYRAAKAGTRIPVLVHANDISSPLLNRDTLTADAVQLFVDGLDEVSNRAAAVAAVLRLHEENPCLPILVSARNADDLPFPEVRLAGFDEDAILAHLYRTAPAAAVAGLFHTLLDDPQWIPLDIRRPRSLAILQNYLTAGALPTSPYDAHERMLRTELGDVGFARAAELARRLLDGEPVSPDDSLTSTTVLVRDTHGMRFAESSDQYFLAAHALSALPLTELLSRANVREWDGAFRTLLAMTRTPQEVVWGVLDAAVGTDPARVGHLLRAAHTRPPELVSTFVTAQQRALRHDVDPSGLAAFGCPWVVVDVVADQATGTTARLTGLRLLARLVDEARPGAEHRAARAALTEAIRAVLSGSADPAVLSCALDQVEVAQLRGLELHVAAHLAPPRPWPVIRSAAGALRELGVALTDQDRRNYHGAARMRLAEVIDTLWRTTSAAAARSLGKERSALVATLAEHPSALDILLSHRFAFDVSGVAALLDRHLPALTRADPTWLLTQVRDGTPDEAITAAHHLFRDWPDHAARLPAQLGDELDLVRLLITAEAVNCSCTDSAATTFLDLLPRVEADRIEGLSALLVAIFRADRGTGVRLAWTAARVLTGRAVTARLYWPWRTALVRCRGELDDLDALLCGDTADVALAVEALGSWDVLGTGMAGPGTLSSEAEEAVWRARPEMGAPAVEIDSWARAVAAVDLRRAVGHLRSLADGAGDAALAVSTNTGVQELRVADVVLDAIAYLERSAQDETGDQPLASVRPAIRSQ